MKIVKTEREKILIGILFVVALAALLYRFVWIGSFARLEELTARKEVLQKELSIGEQASVKLEDLKSKRVLLQRELDDLFKGFYPAHPVAGPLQAVAALENSGIVTSLEPGKGVHHKYYNMLPVSMTVSTDFNGLIKGISSLETEGKAIRIQEVELKGYSESEGAPLSDDSVLEARIKVTLYSVNENKFDSGERSSDDRNIGDPFKPFPSTYKETETLTEDDQLLEMLLREPAQEKPKEDLEPQGSKQE